MQTSNVQSIIGILGAGGEKALPSPPIKENGFGALFSQLESEISHSESEPDNDETTSSEAEFPDEIPLEAETKAPQPQVTKITVLSTQVSTDVGKNTNTNEVTPTQTKPPEIISLAEQTLIASKQLALPTSGLPKLPQGTESIERLAGVENKNGSLVTFQKQPKNDVLEQVQRPANANFETQFLQHATSLQPSNTSFNFSSQKPLTMMQDAQNIDLQLQTSRQALSSHQADRPSTISNQTGTPVSTEQNDLLRTISGLDQARDITPKITASEKQQLSAAPAFPTAQVSVDTAETVLGGSEVTDKFVPTIETTEGELGHISVTLSPSSTSAPEPARAGIVRFAGTQMVDALIRQPNQPVEVALNPEELGRVRISLTQLASGLNVAIMAERPETLELMRRHIEQLETEFRQLGYENIGFEFSGGDTSSSSQPETKNQHSSDMVPDSPDSTPLSPRSVSTQTTGLDIRL